MTEMLVNKDMLGTKDTIKFRQRLAQVRDMRPSFDMRDVFLHMIREWTIISSSEKCVLYPYLSSYKIQKFKRDIWDL